MATADTISPPPGLKKKLSEKLTKHGQDADAALRAFDGMDGQVIELTPEKSKALLRKIDWHLMPVRTVRPSTKRNATDDARSCA
jgi:ACS family allantoate permease-like MFS transporter